MIRSPTPFLILCIVLSGAGCTHTQPHQDLLEVVTYAQFEQFVLETGYVTDAEKFGWSVVQQDVYRFHQVPGANWRKPDGVHPPASPQLPVTQVSYHDAMAYCEWAGAVLPTYDQYWELIGADERIVVTHFNRPISPADEVNVLGNVWEITASEGRQNVRLAGGSVFCSPASCNGTSRDRELYVDQATGNLNIGFAVLKERSR
jgi:hypothetical protein